MDSGCFILSFIDAMLFCVLVGLAIEVTNITTDQFALLALKAHIAADSKKLLSINWSTTTSVCNWMGVTCGAPHHRVTALNLSNMGLTGTIPPHIGNLSFLSSLFFANNTFYGSLSIELARLRRFRYINLGHNSFSGEIPSSLGDPSQLQGLGLHSNNSISDIPTSLCNLSKLERLYSFHHLQHVFLATYEYQQQLPFGVNPPFINVNTSSLRDLYVSFNNMSGHLPLDIFYNLPQVEELYLFHNMFSGRILPSSIPSTIFTMSSVQLLHCDMFTSDSAKFISVQTASASIIGRKNFQASIPEEIGNLTRLQKSYLGINNFNGPIPLVIMNLTLLKRIEFNDNNLSASIGLWLLSLEELVLGSNELPGPIPNSISNDSQLTLLALETNAFSGFIPDSLRNLRNLKMLNLANNLLTTESSSVGMSFLSSLTNCKHLTNLEVCPNSLYGTLPISIGNLYASMRRFYAQGCNIKGSVPGEIGNLTNLIFLDLGYNDLTGTIPTSIKTLAEIQLLFLGKNKLGGAIAMELCVLEKVSELFLGINQLSGLIPQCLKY
ncbi:probable LRR receptor-like serine/threonine-protein kinase At3g47570 [Tripterygium wilfordii]|uniref:probable LRR receptor-like serine/threonine-protein kinase At3g47570 n=1 Tax=Tripterygium wilfordii TaxID=458696 RepID=UPI0018F85A5B|nr:probable LRR receptor-like serine/threonine-protein kinase At3g47570 [Tripterygium wilfordii]